MKVLISVDSSCNLSCSYCDLEKEDLVYDEEKILRTLELIVPSSDELLTVSVYPEPFYDIARTESLCKKILQRFPHTLFDFTTNGLNLGFIDLPLERVLVTLSLDGLESTQNLSRGNCDRIIFNFKKWKDRYKIIRVSSVLTKDSVKDLSKNVLYFYELGFCDIRVQLDRTKGLTRSEDLQVLREQLQILYDDFIKNGRLDSCSLNLFSFLPETSQISMDDRYCKSYGDLSRFVSIKMDGTLSPCIMTPHVTVEEARDRTYRILNLDSECQSCKLLSVCRTCPGETSKSKNNCGFVKLCHEFSTRLLRYYGRDVSYVQLEDAEISSYVLIQQKIQCARFASDPRMIPQDATSEQVHLFVNNVLGILSGYEYLEKDWWMKIRKKYNLGNKPCEYHSYSDKLVVRNFV